jgi:tRNA threonylcarbamoyladenosine biosynthesis protein TsaE
MSEKAGICLLSTSESQTVELGRLLGRNLRPSMVIALVGELGAGKTSFIHGVAMGLDVPSDEGVSSPSFSLIHEYMGRLPLYHMDFFRLEPADFGPEMGLEEYLEGDGVCVIEWADRNPGLLAREHLEVMISILDKDSRRIEMFPRGETYNELIKELERGIRSGGNTLPKIIEGS